MAEDSPDEATAADGGEGPATSDGQEDAPRSFTAKSVATGSHHTCALTSGGAVLCWGDNRFGQVGDGSIKQRTTPVLVAGLDHGVTAIAAGDLHTCAINAEGGVLCWGSNTSGALGDGSTTKQLSFPAQVAGLKSGVGSIAAGGADTCVVTTEGKALCWGGNVSGQLGDGTMDDRNSPVVPKGLSANVAAIAVANDHMCAVTTEGAVLCSGDDANGALGTGNSSSTVVPVASQIAGGAISISASVGITCALNMDSGPFCWGFGGRGELGTGNRMASSSPVPVSGLSSDVKCVVAGLGHACAVNNAGGVLCWGNNAHGELGDGTTKEQLAPIPVPGLSSGTAGVATGTGTCAVTAAGAVLCWGGNTYGEVGDGTTTERHTPMPVVSFP
jgi:alpha-tubulin suppressor-like RCC1 family protein